MVFAIGLFLVGAFLLARVFKGVFRRRKIQRLEEQALYRYGLDQRLDASKGHLPVLAHIEVDPPGGKLTVSRLRRYGRMLRRAYHGGRNLQTRWERVAEASAFIYRDFLGYEDFRIEGVPSFSYRGWTIEVAWDGFMYVASGRRADGEVAAVGRGHDAREAQVACMQTIDALPSQAQA